MLSPAGEVVQGFALRRVPFAPDQKGVGRAKSTRPERRRAPKAPGGAMPPNPRGGGKEKFAQPKSGKLALVVVNAAFLTAEQIFLKAWKARAFSFTPTYFGEPKKSPGGPYEAFWEIFFVCRFQILTATGSGLQNLSAGQNEECTYNNN